MPKPRISNLDAADAEYLENSAGYLIPKRGSLRAAKEASLGKVREAIQEASRLGASREEISKVVDAGFELGVVEGVHEA